MYNNKNLNWKMYREYNRDLVEVGLKEGRLWRVYDKHEDLNHEMYRKNVCRFISTK